MAAFKHHESNKSMEEVEIDVQTSVASPLLFCRKQCFKTETIWTIFWRDHEDIFGVTDGETKIFEKKIPIAERMKFCGNVSASLLTEKWRKIFTDAAFKLTFKDDDEDELEVEMTHGTVTLQRIEEPGHIKAIFNEMVEAYNKISKKHIQVEEKKLVENIRDVAQKRKLSRPNNGPPQKTRRTRDPPTGVQFSDIITKI